MALSGLLGAVEHPVAATAAEPHGPRSTPALIAAPAAARRPTAPRFVPTSAGWSCTGRWSAHVASVSATTAGSSCRVSVSGARVELHALRGPDQGLISVSVDRGRPTTVNLYAARRVADAAVLTLPALRGARHTVAVTATGRRAPASHGNGATLLRARPLPAAHSRAGTPPAGLVAGTTPRAGGPLGGTAGAGSGFVTRSGSDLQLGGRPFRFAGTNMYWLALDDNVKDAGGATYPTAYRIDDAMTSAQDMGATVVRAWAGTVGCARCIEPSLGHFNDAAFASLDYAISSAQQHGMRVALDLVDNWAYYSGGKLTFTGWRGKGESAFFSDPTVIADYLAYIDHVVSHVNPYTHLAYRDDPTVMAWETGNEIWCQTCDHHAWDPRWTQQVADHLTSVAPRQLVIDGHGTENSCLANCLDAASLSIPSVDLVDDHFYPMRATRVRDASAQAARAGKAYLIGEYDWVNHDARGDSLPAFLAAVESSPVAGDLSWALIPHFDGGGFVDHNDGFQLFYPGLTADARDRGQRLRQHAATMRGTTAGARLVPAAPVLLGAVRGPAGTKLVWRGAAGAAAYVVQRSLDGVAWSTVATGLQDTLSDADPGWTDPAALAGSSYRLAAVNLDGMTGAWSAPLPSSS